MPSCLLIWSVHRVTLPGKVYSIDNIRSDNTSSVSHISLTFWVQKSFYILAVGTCWFDSENYLCLLLSCRWSGCMYKVLLLPYSHLHNIQIRAWCFFGVLVYTRLICMPLLIAIDYVQVFIGIVYSLHYLVCKSLSLDTDSTHYQIFIKLSRVVEFHLL